MTCACDRPSGPALPSIPPGLPRLSRTVGRFGTFRAALLSAGAAAPALAAWRARGGDDLGIMLLDFAAYVAAVQAFYDEVHANESYLRTARREASVAALVGCLGYVPRAAVAANAWLALELTGRGPLALRAGTAFRSAAFEGSPPQIFETTAPAMLHADRSSLPIATSAARLAASGAASEFIIGRTTSLLPGAVIALRGRGFIRVNRVASITDSVDGAGRVLMLETPVALPADTTAADLSILAPALAARLWSVAPLGGDGPAVDAAARVLVLDAPQRAIGPGDAIIAECAGELRLGDVASVHEVSRIVQAAGSVKVENEDGDDVSVGVPALTAMTTEVTLVAGFNAGMDDSWTTADAPAMRLHFGLTPAAKVLRTPAIGVALEAGATLPLAPSRFAPEEDWSGHAALTDARGRSAVVDAALDATTRRLTIGAVPPGLPVLQNPITVRANLVAVTRGQTVPGEILGSGDGARASQAFTLKNKPLTHLAGDGGIAAALEVRVDGFLWAEARSFFGRGPAERIYILRCGPDGAATITFGDGVRGARLPTGKDNITATYRFGAGAPAPPAGGITQPAGPVPRLAAVRQPEAAFGGADAEGLETLRSAAPRSALLLDRIVSLPDAEALVAQQPGVVAARADWAWMTDRQRPMLRILYIGVDDLVPAIAARLRAAADPALPVALAPAWPSPLHLSIAFATAPGLKADARIAAVRAALADPAAGLLAPARIGIGTPLYRSAIVAAVLAVPDVVSVTDIAVAGVPFPEFALPPVPSGYYDITGRLALNGEVA